MSRTRTLAAVLILGVSLACGGGSAAPSRVPTATPAPLPAPTARDGWTEASVAATFNPGAPALGTRVTVQAPGFLTREVAFTGEPVYLWPQDEDYVRALVYHEPDAAPGRRLFRWTSGFAISSEGLDGAHLDTAADAAAEASRVTGLAITVQPTGPVVVVADPNDEYFTTHAAIAYTQIRVTGNAIASARVVFRSSRDMSSGRSSRRNNTFLHEIGHALGLGHSIDPGDVMSVDFDRRSERTFSEREEVALRLVYRWRRGGNLAPDRDPAAGAADGRSHVIVIED